MPALRLHKASPPRSHPTPNSLANPNSFPSSFPFPIPSPSPSRVPSIAPVTLLYLPYHPPCIPPLLSYCTRASTTVITKATKKPPSGVGLIFLSDFLSSSSRTLGKKNCQTGPFKPQITVNLSRNSAVFVRCSQIQYLTYLFHLHKVTVAPTLRIPTTARQLSPDQRDRRRSSCLHLSLHSSENSDTPLDSACIARASTGITTQHQPAHHPSRRPSRSFRCHRVARARFQHLSLQQRMQWPHPHFCLLHRASGHL